MSQKHSLALSKQDLNLTEPKTFVEDLDVLHGQKQVVIYIPAKYFTAHHQGLADINNNVAIHNVRAKMLYFLSESVQDLAKPKKKESKSKNIKVTFSTPQENFQENEANEDTTIEENADDDAKTKFFWFRSGNEYYSRLDVYFEVVKSMTGSVHGYRYWIIVNDPKLDINSQIAYKFDRNVNLSRMKEAPLNCEVSHELNGIHSWVVKFLAPYLGVSNLTSSTYFMKLTDPLSDANVYNVLSFEKSCAPFEKPDDLLTDEYDDQYICAEQCNPETYFEAGAVTKFSQQEKVTYIPLDQFTPHHLLVTKFPHLQSFKTELLKGESEAKNLLEQKLRLDLAITYLRYPQLKPVETERNLRDDDDFVQLKKKVVELKEEWGDGCAKSKRKMWIRSNLCATKNNEVMETFNYIWSATGNINDVMKNIVAWEKNNTKKIKEFQIKNVIDESKTPFLNMTALMMQSYEKFGVIHMHSHLHMMFGVALGALHADNDGIHTHMAQAGPANAGKSYLMKILVKLLMICGTIRMMALITEKAFLTNTDHSNLVVAFDEVDNKYAGVETQNGKTVEGGNGSSIIKMAFTNGSSEVNHTHIDSKTGERKTITTIINQRCVYIGNMSGPVYFLSEPIRRRWLINNAINYH